MDSKLLYAELLKYGGYRQGAIRRLSASQLTPTWLENNGTFRPVLIPAPSDEGAAAAAAIVKTPAGGITAETLVMSLGPATPVRTFDSPTQEEGPLWTLHQWKIYWNKKTGRQTLSHKPQDGSAPPVATDTTAAPSTPFDLPLEGIDKDYLTRLFCLPALPITGTPLEREILAPSAVQAVDLLNTCLGVNEAIPQAHLPIMLGMYPNKSFVHSTMAPGGASVWIYVVTGTATIAVSPPVAKNLATYAAWACGGKNSGIFLPSKCEGSSKAELTAGDTLILPPGYIYSLAVTSSAVIISGGFLRSDSLAIHLDALRIEEAADVALRKQYPEFKQLMWRTASRYAALLGERMKNKMDNFEEKVASRVIEMEKEDRKVAAKARAQSAAAAAKAASRPSSAAGLAIRDGGDGGRRRKRHADDFIQSDSDWSGGFKGGGGVDDDDEDDEGEWVPGARQYRGKAESEDNSGEEREDDDVLDSDAEQMDLEYSEYDDDDDLDGQYGKRKTKRRKKGTVEGKVIGERQSKRQRARRGEGEEDMALGVASVRSVALNLSGMPPSSLKLKLKLPVSTATKSGVEQQQPKPSPIKLTIKRPTAPPQPPAADTIPQVDGPGDDDIEQIELSEGEEQGLPALYLTLRGWLRQSPTAAVTASTALQNIQNPWTVLARFEIALKEMKLLDVVSDDDDHPPPVCVNLSAISRETLEPTGAPFQEKFCLLEPGGNYGDDYNTYDRDSMSDQSGDNAAMIDEIHKEREIYSHKKMGGGGGGGGSNGSLGSPESALAAAGSGGKGASNGGGLGGGYTTAAQERSHGPGTAGTTPGGSQGGKVLLNNTAATAAATATTKMKKFSTKDRLKKKLGL